MGDGTSSFSLRLYLQQKGSCNQVTQISTNQCDKCQKHSRNGSCAQPMNLKGENLGTYGLEGMKGSLIEPSEVGLNFDT